MRSVILPSALLLAFVQTAAAWAILLGAPELQYPAGATQEAITAAEEEMKRLSFKSGVIHVSAPQPIRNLRFNEPGHKIIALVALLEKVGFHVKVSQSETMAAEQGFVIVQQEDGGNRLGIVINSKHPKFDADKFGAAKLTTEESPER